MARSNIQLEESLNILLKRYAKAQIRLPTVKKELEVLRREVRKKTRGRRNAFKLISRYEAIFRSLKKKKIIGKKIKNLSKKPKKWHKRPKNK